VLYTGGPRPYGYSGFGELAVLVFFGLVATCGSAYVQAGRVPSVAWPAAVAVGLMAVAVLLANNVRDIDTDTVAGKRTLAVRLGRRGSRAAFVAALAGAFAAIAVTGVLHRPALVALLAAPLALAPAATVLRRADGPALVGALVGTVRLQLVTCLLLAGGLLVGS
jgi:1,4-dihydroxy-2-naphthoate octaprenyltransferase